jgi:ribonuclease BN (tRNA processing enzyme)
MRAIDHVLLSHSHLDHIHALPLLADSVIRSREEQGRAPLLVHALPQTIEALRAHIFNGTIWPDFARLPSAEHPVLRFVPFAVGDTLDIGGRRIEVLVANHTVPAVGFALRIPASDASEPGGARWWVFTGDTGPNPALWQRLRGMDIAHLVIETAFSDEERELARISRHLCPGMLCAELAQLAGSVDVHITHIKPGEDDAVMDEIAALGMGHRIDELHAGQVIELG